MEEEHIAGRKLYRHSFRQQGFVSRQIGSQEQGGIELTRLEIQRVGTGDDQQSAVMCILGAQCQPRADQLAPIKAPVANILMPTGDATESGVFGHDTVVMILRKANDICCHQRLQHGHHLWMPSNLLKQRVPAKGMQQAPRSTSTRRGFGRRCAWVMHVRLKLDRCQCRRK